MDICTLTGSLVHQGKKSHCQLCVDPLELTPKIIEDLPVDKLANAVTEMLKFQDKPNRVLENPSSGEHGVDKKDINGVPCSTEFITLTSVKNLSKSHSFPSSRKIMSSASASHKEGEDRIVQDGAGGTGGEELTLHNDKAASLAPSRSVSLPTSLKLVPAIKGSREKLGTTREKLSVTWAPDVYDPTPTSVSHVVTGNKSQKHGKKNGKNKQKSGSKPSRGSKGKDKKQTRKQGGSSHRGSKVVDCAEEVIDLRKLPSGMNFHVGNPDQLCGGSFFEKSIASLHFSVAEAT